MSEEIDVNLIPEDAIDMSEEIDINIDIMTEDAIDMILSYMNITDAFNFTACASRYTYCEARKQFLKFCKFIPVIREHYHSNNRYEMENYGLVKWTELLSTDRHHMKNAWLAMPAEWRKNQTKTISFYTTQHLQTISLSLHSIMEKLV